MVRRLVPLLLAMLLLLAGCGGAEQSPVSRPAISSQSEPPQISSSATTSAPAEPPPEPDTPPDNPYLNRLVADAIAKFATPEMTEYEKAKAAFDYMIANTVLDEPIGLD